MAGSSLDGPRITNRHEFFNPNPWIFWSLTGVPILLEDFRQAANHGASNTQKTNNE
jgi:hypothetical protein